MAGFRLQHLLGLVTDPSYLTAPPGSMLVADDVMIHRPGALQPRPGFGDTTGIASRSTTFRPIKASHYRFGQVVVVQSRDGANYRLERLGSSTVYTTADGAPPEPTVRGVSPMVSMRDALYVATSTGMRKLAINGPSSYRRAGVWQTYAPVAATLTVATASDDRVAVGSGSQVAYRWVVRRTDELDNVYRGAPSARILVAAAAGTYPNGARVTLAGANSFLLPSDAIQGDVIEFYRTYEAAIGSDPGEDYYLAVTYELDGTDISNGYITGTVLDDVEEGQLGATLYTSASQFGVVEAKEIPPIATHLVEWNGCLWAGRTQERTALALSLQKVAYESGATVRLEGLGLCYLDNISYGGVSGGDTLTGVSFGAGLGWGALSVGMWIGDSITPEASAGDITAGTTIAAFDQGAGTITLSQAGGDVLGGNVFAGDVFKVGSQGYYAAASTDGTDATYPRFTVVMTDTDHENRCYLTSIALATAICQFGAINGEPYAIKDWSSTSSLGFGGGSSGFDNGTGNFLLVAQHPEDATVTAQCATRGTAFAPDLTSQEDAEDGLAAGRVAWSAIDEPEAWPLLQTLVAGSITRDVLALASVVDALLIFKEDGIYRVTGAPPSSFVVDEVDLDMRLVAPEAVCTLDGVCYAWTDRGVVAITSDGRVQGTISEQIDDKLREYQRNWPRRNTDAKRSAYMVAHRRLGLVILAISDDPTADTCDEWLVWCRETNTWTTWKRTDRCALYDPDEDRLLVGLGTDAWEMLYERSDEDSSSAYHDRNLVALSASVSGQVATIAQADFGTVVPDSDDVLYDGSEYFVVESVSPSGGDYLITLRTLEGEPTQGAVTMDYHQAIQCVATWAPLHAMNVGHRWLELHAAFVDGKYSYIDTLEAYLGGYAHYTSSLAGELVRARIDLPFAVSDVIRAGLPRAIVRTPHYYPKITIATCGTLWRMSDLTVHATPTSYRTTRTRSADAAAGTIDLGER